MKPALIWLGLSSLAFWLLLCIELVVRVPAALAPRAFLYLAALSLLASAWASLPVALVHVLRLLPERSRPRAALAACVLLGLGALPAVITLSRFLVTGAWVSTLPYVRVLRVGIAIFGATSFQLLLAWHAFGTSAELRAAIEQRFGAKAMAACSLAFWVAGSGVLLIVFIALGSLLRPYGLLAAQLLYPSWLIAATLVFRLLEQRPRAGLVLASAMIGLGLAGSLVPLLDRAGDLALRGALLETEGLGALTEARVGRRRPTDRFDFGGARDRRCAKPRKERALALTTEQRRNVILISMDTLRRDAIGKRFGQRAVAPNLEAFGRESIFFARAATPASFTIGAVGSAFSGRSMSQLTWMSRIPQNIFSRTSKLFERELAVLPEWGFLQCYSFRQLVLQGVPTRYTARDADPGPDFIKELQRARKRGERGLFWLHVADPHSPYNPHPATDFGDDKIARYYGEVAYDDAILGRVFDYLRSSGYYQDSLIIFFSDHGESLGEKGGYFGHGVSNAGRLGDVPLYVRYPGVQPRVSNAAVSITSIAPSVWHYLNQSIPGAVDACSLLLPESALSACPKPISALFGSGLEAFEKIVRRPMRTRHDLVGRQYSLARWQRFAPQVTAVSSEHRYLRDLQTGAEHLYRRTELDPDERHDLGATHPELLRAFRDDVARWQHTEAKRVVCQLKE